jgi:hypothetical protein
MLQIDLRELVRGPVEMRADLAGTDPLFEGLEVTLAEPVRVAGRLQDAGDGRFYWRASLRSRMVGECRPRWVVCREDCRGLCPRCGKDLNAGACGCPAPVDPRWGGLTAVRHKLHD